METSTNVIATGDQHYGPSYNSSWSCTVPLPGPWRLFPDIVVPTIVPNSPPVDPTWPNVVPVTPFQTNPCFGGGIVIDVQHSWHVVVSGATLTARCDVPGVRVEDLSVEINEGAIVASYKRFDTHATGVLKQFIGNEYDPDTASATLEAGTLSVVIEKFREKRTKRVPVAAK